MSHLSAIHEKLTMGKSAGTMKAKFSQICLLLDAATSVGVSVDVVSYDGIVGGRVLLVIDEAV